MFTAKIDNRVMDEEVHQTPNDEDRKGSTTITTTISYLLFSLFPFITCIFLLSFILFFFLIDIQTQSTGGGLVNASVRPRVDFQVEPVCLRPSPLLPSCHLPLSPSTLLPYHPSFYPSLLCYPFSTLPYH